MEGEVTMYTDRQARLARAFCHSGTSCVVECDCGRIHFVSASGHGDYEDGELEKLQQDAEKEPTKYVEEAHYDTIDVLNIHGMTLIPDCPCGKAERYAAFLEDHAEEVAVFVASYLTDQRKEAEAIAAESKRLLDQLEAAQAADGWLPIKSGPHNLALVEVKDEAGVVYADAHWASDLSGEEQPPFEGWFIPIGSGYRQIDKPKYWRPKGEK